MKKSCPACQGYPTCQGDTTHPTELSRPPRRVCDPNVNGWLNLERNKLNVTSARVARGEGCLGCPRPYINLFSIALPQTLASMVVFKAGRVLPYYMNDSLKKESSFLITKSAALETFEVFPRGGNHTKNWLNIGSVPYL